MFAKIYEFKEVLIFYILLILILFAVSMRNKEIDMNLTNNDKTIISDFY